MATSKLAWMSLKADDARLPDELQEAIRALDEAREQVEAMVRECKPAPKGRKWVFTYKYGVAIALTEASGTTSYFD